MFSHPRFGRPIGGHGRHIPPPNRYGFHYGRPGGALFWDRPLLPPILSGALYGWVWINDPWYFWLDGVYYYGEGYYYDGYNYCYNGGYYLCPPPTGQVINTMSPSGYWTAW